MTAPILDDIDHAARLLREGALVAFPTETVYGLGADATNGAAVAAIYAAKGRPRFNPLIAHVPDLAAAGALVDLPPALRALAKAYWPGPLTLVAPCRGEVTALMRAGHDTLAVRVPAHPVAQQLLRAVGRPLAAPSANPSGRISPTRAAHVAEGLGIQIAAILEGGACAVGVESTIVGLENGQAVILRPGGIALDLPLATPRSAPDAPGQLSSHYAPHAAVRLGALKARKGEILLGFGPVAGDLSLSPTGDLHEAAAQLFDLLHQLDATGRPIAVAPIPGHGLGRAINDRLRRAAAPRPE